MSRRQRITAIEQQEKRPERRSIFIDGKFALGVHQETMLRLGLHVGQEVTEQKLGELVKAEVTRQARESAYKLLSYRARSEQELRQRLRLKNYPDEVVEQVVADLIELDLINDVRFSRDWVENRTLARPAGKSRLTWELRQKGVDPETIEETMELIDPDTEEALALDLGRAKLERMREPDAAARRRRLASLLRGRGFSWDTIGKVLNTLVPDEDSIE